MVEQNREISVIEIFVICFIGGLIEMATGIDMDDRVDRVIHRHW